jgi:hypothetical protein
MRLILLMLCFAAAVPAQESKVIKPTLGQLSEKYESGGRGPGTVSTGEGDPGGVSYGTYQLASKVGRADEFVKKYYSAEFKDLKGGSDEFTKVWKKLAKDDPAALHKNEHEFIKVTHYDPQAKKLKKDVELDIDLRSAALRDVVWSTAVHHGPNSGLIAKVVKELTKETKLADVTDETIIKAIYAERGRKDDDGNLVYFKRVSEKWKPALSKRFVNECADALELLKKK